MSLFGEKKETLGVWAGEGGGSSLARRKTCAFICLADIFRERSAGRRQAVVLGTSIAGREKAASGMAKNSHCQYVNQGCTNGVVPPLLGVKGS